MMYKDRRRRLTSPISLFCAPETMPHCKHHDLVEVSASAPHCLVDPNRLGRIAEVLLNPHRQQPLVIACVGAQEKTLALEQLFPANDAKSRNARPSLCKAYVDVLTAHAPNPIVFLEVDIQRELAVQDARAHCHQFKAFKIQAEVDTEKLDTMVLRRLILPFADVACIFVDDLGGLPATSQYLQSWTSPRTEVSKDILCRLVLVVLDDGSGVSELEDVDVLESLRTSTIGKIFASVRIQRVPKAPLRNVRYLPLREAVLKSDLEAAQASRHMHMSLYTATHLAALFSQCLAHTSKSVRRPFDIFEASRYGIPKLPQLTECLAAFLRAMRRETVPHQSLASLLATALLMQAYPPSSHR